jgi:hypothetical protein
LLIKTLLQFQQKLRAQVIELGLGIHQQQNNFPTGQPIEVDHSCAASLAHALPRPAHFAQTARTRNHIACERIVSNPVNELCALSVTPDLGRPLDEFWGLNNCVYIFIVTTNNWFNNYLLLRLMIQNLRVYSYANAVKTAGGLRPG